MPNKFFGNDLPEFLHHSWLSLHAYLENQGPRSISRNINVFLMNVYFMVNNNKLLKIWLVNSLNKQI